MKIRKNQAKSWLNQFHFYAVIAGPFCLVLALAYFVI